jgi:hypothetical protein
LTDELVTVSNPVPQHVQLGMNLFQQDTKATEKTSMAEAMTEVLIAHQRAMAYPRSPEKKAEIIYAMCQDINFASDAIYKVTSKGEGLKVQTMKSIAQIWGNIRAGVIHHGEYGDESQIETYAIELENNFSFSETWTVSHKTKQGDTVKLLPNPDRIFTHVKANASKSARSTMSSVIPDWLQDNVKRLCKQTMHRDVPDVKRAWHDSLKFFKESCGVDAPALLAWVDCKDLNPDHLTPAHIVELRILASSLKEGLESADQIFPSRDKKIQSSFTEKKPAKGKGAAATTVGTDAKQEDGTDAKEQQQPTSEASQASAATSTKTVDAPATTTTASAGAANTAESQATAQASEVARSSTSKDAAATVTQSEPDGGDHGEPPEDDTSPEPEQKQLALAPAKPAAPPGPSKANKARF